MLNLFKKLIIMASIKYRIYQNKGLAGVKDKYYARAFHDETIGLEQLAEHMSMHNTPYSKGTIHGVLKDMVVCVKELLLDSKKVKLDDLAIFSIGIVNNLGGAESAKEFNTAKNIKGVKLRARATGELSTVNLNLAASLKKATVVVNGTVVEEDPITPETPDDSGTDEPIVENPEDRKSVV